MESAKRLYVVLSLLVIVVLASGCQGQATAPLLVGAATPTPISSSTSSPTPMLGKCNSALLPGHILSQSEKGIHELTCTQTGTVQDKVIATWPGYDFDYSAGSLAKTISPDGRFLRYAIPPSDNTSTTFEV